MRGGVAFVLVLVFVACACYLLRSSVSLGSSLRAHAPELLPLPTRDAANAVSSSASSTSMSSAAAGTSKPAADLLVAFYIARDAADAQLPPDLRGMTAAVERIDALCAALEDKAAHAWAVESACPWVKSVR